MASNLQTLYILDIGKKGEDQYVYRHSNGLCVVGVAPSHPILQSGRTVTLVDYNVTKQSRLNNKVVGKGKKGGLWLEPASPLCDVTCNDGTKFRLYSCIRGHLLEVNENLVTNPALLSQKPNAEGYISIINPKHMEQETVVDKLVTLEEYRKTRNLT